MGYKVDQLVDTCACSFEKRIGLSFFISWFIFVLLLTNTLSLYDIVVPLGTVDLTEETKRFASKIVCKLLDRLLQSISLLLTETDASPLIDTGLFHEVLNLSPNRVGLRDDAFIIGLSLSKERHSSPDVLLLVLGDLSVVMEVVASDELIRVSTLLDHE